MPKTILFLAANPIGTEPLRLDEEVREIDEGLRRAGQRDKFKLVQKWAVRPVDLRRAMLDYNPQIVHFSGHGSGTAGIVLENELGKAQLVGAEALASLFSLFPGVRCVFLNACYSEEQAQAIVRYVKHVIGMAHGIDDRAAIKFAVSFYDALGAGRSIEFAFQFARAALRLEGYPDISPVLKVNKSIKDRKRYRHQQYDR